MESEARRGAPLIALSTFHVLHRYRARSSRDVPVMMEIFLCTPATIAIRFNDISIRWQVAATVKGRTMRSEAAP